MINLKLNIPPTSLLPVAPFTEAGFLCRTLEPILAFIIIFMAVFH